MDLLSHHKHDVKPIQKILETENHHDANFIVTDDMGSASMSLLYGAV